MLLHPIPTKDHPIFFEVASDSLACGCSVLQHEETSAGEMPAALTTSPTSLSKKHSYLTRIGMSSHWCDGSISCIKTRAWVFKILFNLLSVPRRWYYLKHCVTLLMWMPRPIARRVNCITLAPLGKFVTGHFPALRLSLIEQNKPFLLGRV